MAAGQGGALAGAWAKESQGLRAERRQQAFGGCGTEVSLRPNSGCTPVTSDTHHLRAALARQRCCCLLLGSAATALCAPCPLPRTLGAGVASVAYAVIGVFAAARYGLRTEGDVLVNAWLPGRWDGVLSASMTFYLSVRRDGRSTRSRRSGGGEGGMLGML